jgi:polyisoprenyl-teichoic acid--peptidoglycan teichoic acid transferase
LVVKQQPAVITPVQSVPQPAPVMQSAPATQIQKPRPVRQKTLLDMALPEGSSINRHHMSPRIRKQVKNARTMVMRSAFAMSTMVIVVGGVLFSQGLLNVNKVFKGTAQHAAALDEDVDVNKLKGEGDGRINVLLTGIGGEKHAGGDLTDTLMLASIDPVNNTAALLSVPRDMWVTIPGKGSMKINAAYATAKYEYMRKNKVPATDTGANTAGFTAIDQTMEQVLGVPIHYNLLVNFQAFRQSIDTVGGITINVPEDLYDPTMAWENNRDPYLARAGSQDFDGKRALMYARSRETSSDFARGERQRAVLLALKEKTISAGILANPTKLNGLLSAFGNNVQTDLSISDANRLYSIMKRINNSNITSVSLAGTTSTTSSGAGDDTLITTGNINGQSIVQPLAGLENYDDIQEYVRSKLQDGYITKEKARVLVVNGTVESGLAQRTADKLKSYGYNVIGTATTQTDVYPDTVVVDRTNGKSKYTKNYLEQRYNVKATKILKDTSITPGTADFVVILGSDSTD